MSREEPDLVNVLTALRNANAMIIEAIDAYLEAKALAEVEAENVESIFPSLDCLLCIMLHEEKCPECGV